MKAEFNQPPQQTKGIAVETKTATVPAEAEITRVPYICGPITGLPPFQHDDARRVFCQLADACKAAFGRRGWVPHEHLEDIDPHQASTRVREQIRQSTSIMLVLGLADSWGGGMAVEMAHQYGVPVILFASSTSIRISPQLLGHPAITAMVRADNLQLLILPDHLPETLQSIVREHHIALPDPLPQLQSRSHVVAVFGSGAETRA